MKLNKCHDKSVLNLQRLLQKFVAKELKIILLDKIENFAKFVATRVNILLLDKICNRNKPNRYKTGALFFSLFQSIRSDARDRDLAVLVQTTSPQTGEPSLDSSRVPG